MTQSQLRPFHVAFPVDRDLGLVARHASSPLSDIDHESRKRWRPEAWQRALAGSNCTKKQLNRQ